MANKNQGQVSVKFAGKTIKLKLTFNGICELEDLHKSDIASITARLSENAQGGKVSFIDMRAILWASMLDPLPDASIPDAGELAQSLGQEKLGETVNAVMVGSGLFGDPDDQADSTKDQDAGKTKAGTR